MAAFCGMRNTKEEILAAVSYSGFEQMKRMEEEGLPYPAGQAGFVRKGIVGAWKEEMDKESLEKVLEISGEMMQRLGYLT
jgi:hypothetical protein